MIIVIYWTRRINIYVLCVSSESTESGLGAIRLSEWTEISKQCRSNVYCRYQCSGSSNRRIIFEQNSGLKMNRRHRLVSSQAGDIFSVVTRMNDYV